MSEGGAGHSGQWTLRRLFRIPGAGASGRGKVRDSIVVIGVTQDSVVTNYLNFLNIILDPLVVTDPFE